MKLYPNLLDPELIPDILQLYKQSANQVTINGKTSERFNVSHNRGLVLLSKYNDEEFKFIWDSIKDKLPEGTTVASNRILKYRTGGHFRRHVDGRKAGTPEQNVSLIIQLSDPSSNYVGGDMTVNDEPIDLGMGDAVAYWYGEPHEVKMLYEGARYVVNLRLFIPE